MLIFGHIGVTLGVFFGLGIFIPRLRTTIDSKYLAIGALLPDLIDKPLGRVIFASTFENGRIIGHTLFFSLILFLIGLYLYKKKEISGLFLLPQALSSILWKIKCGQLLKLYSGLFSD